MWSRRVGRYLWLRCGPVQLLLPASPMQHELPLFGQIDRENWADRPPDFPLGLSPSCPVCVYTSLSLCLTVITGRRLKVERRYVSACITQQVFSKLERFLKFMFHHFSSHYISICLPPSTYPSSVSMISLCTYEKRQVMQSGIAWCAMACVRWLPEWESTESLFHPLILSRNNHLIKRASTDTDMQLSHKSTDAAGDWS